MLTRMTAAYVAVFLLFGPHIASFFEPLNRRLYLWERNDAALLLSMTIAVAGTFLLISTLLRRIIGKKYLPVADHAFLIALGAGLLANIAFHFDLNKFAAPMQTAWLILFAGVGWSLARPQASIAQHARKICLVLSPGVLLVAIQLAGQPTYPSPLDAWNPENHNVQATTQSESTTTPVYLFVFDEWSYARTFEDGQLNSNFSQIARLADSATVFHNAHSPATCTIESMPRLLFQVDESLYMNNGQIGFGVMDKTDANDTNDNFIQAKDRDNLFAAAKRNGYSTSIIGFMLPYKMWFGKNVDFCRSYSRYQHPYSPTERMALHLFNAAQHWTDPWLPAVRIRLEDWEDATRVAQIRRDEIQDTIRVIKESPPNTFALFHHILPHAPFLTDNDAESQSLTNAMIEDELEGYRKNLAFLDATIGRFVDAMVTANRFDDALIIITSDHGWRYDPVASNSSGDELTHIPLIVKFPHQQKSETVTDRFETMNVGRWIEAAFAGKLKQDTPAAIIPPSLASATDENNG